MIGVAYYHRRINQASVLIGSEDVANIFVVAIMFCELNLFSLIKGSSLFTCFISFVPQRLKDGDAKEIFGAQITNVGRVILGCPGNKLRNERST